MNQKSTITTIFVGLLLLLQVQMSVEAASNKTIPCHSGKIASISLIKSAPKVLNLDKNILPSKVKDSHAAYAKILMTPDPGRSLGVYDYVLVDDKGKEYPCIAIKKGKDDFDAANWFFDKCKPNTRYTLLFKIEYSAGRASYNLKYQYPVNKPELVPLSFKLSKTSSSTPAPKPQPTPAPKPKKTAAKPVKTAAKPVKTTHTPSNTTSNKSSHTSKKKTSDSTGKRHKKKQKK